MLAILIVGLIFAVGSMLYAIWEAGEGFGLLIVGTLFGAGLAVAAVGAIGIMLRKEIRKLAPRQ
jgi:hypothetical protein